ncbi:MAG: hypothetical protein JW798_18665, partial [Prolixibacteraceae bacterium]|nr:hypothetical protein [Prolixibacteraceae bacterium]
MKKMNVYIVFYLVIAVFLISASMYNAGSPGKKTGSPLDGASCTQCHSGTPAEAELITSNIPETGYVPGQTYNITLTASNADAQKFGFEITSENNSEKTGTFAITESNRTKLTNNNKAVT